MNAAEMAPPQLQAPGPSPRDWALSLGLMALTFASTLWVGSQMPDPRTDELLGWANAWTFSLPLMAILMTHEFGHFIAGRIHGVDISPPYFIPIPMFLGTFGAVIRMGGPIRDRNALLDVGASGPLAGLAVALPIVAYGVWSSPVLPIEPDATLIIEGRSLLYLALLYGFKGPIPAGSDIMLTPTALAGWAGLLVTMINLIPVAQLDGGHVAYAVLGPRQDLFSERLRRLLPLIAVVVGGAYAAEAYWQGKDWSTQLFAGVHWLFWAGILWVITRVGGRSHPPTGPGELSAGRKRIAYLTLALFALLFMPSWSRAG